MLLGIFEKLMDFAFGPFKLFPQILVLLGQLKLFLFGQDFVLSEGLIGLFKNAFGLGQFLVIGLSVIAEGCLKSSLKFLEDVGDVLWRIGFFIGQGSLEVRDLFGEGSFKLGTHIKEFIMKVVELTKENVVKIYGFWGIINSDKL